MPVISCMYTSSTSLNEEYLWFVSQSWTFSGKEVILDFSKSDQLPVGAIDPTFFTVTHENKHKRGVAFFNHAGHIIQRVSDVLQKCDQNGIYVTIAFL